VFPLGGLVSENWATLSWSGKILDYFWHMALPITTLGRGSDSPKTGYMGVALWNGGTKSHPGPETFSEWMIYELK
jgi:hypothetical protein